MTAKAKRFRPPQRVRQAFGPFKGMRTAIEERASDPSLVDYAYNMLPTGPGGAYTVRPPAIRTSGLPVERRRGYHVYTDAGDVVHVVTIVSGELWVLEQNQSWARWLTTATLAAAGIGISGTGPIGFCTFAGKLIVSDGMNAPWAWDGTLNGGLTRLTDCPVLYGPPTEYGGKLFGIKAVDRRTIVWSEENDPTTGYEAGGFNNAWTIAQQGDEPLTRLLGRNDALYYWRPHSTGAISGATASDFRTTHTHDAVSTTEGTIDPRSIVDTGDALWWYTTNEQVVRYVIGGGMADVTPELSASPVEDLVGGVTPRWMRSAAQLRLTDQVSAAAIGPNHANRRRQVWFSLPGLASTGVRMHEIIILVYDAATAQPLGWLGADPVGTTIGANLTAVTVGTVDMSPTVVGASSGGMTVALTDDVFGGPYVWQYVPETGAPVTDGPSGLVVRGTLVGPIAGGTDDIELYWDRCDVSLRVPGNPSGTGTVALTATASSDPAGTTLSTTVPGRADVSTARLAYGLDSVGRWLRPRFTCQWNQTPAGFGIQGYTLSGAGANEDPDAA